MIEKWRLFVAIELPDGIVAELDKAQKSLKRILPAAALKWVQPGGIHLTLKFLGDVSVDQIEDIVTGLGVASRRHEPFILSVAGLGCFPTMQRPRVLWVGLTGSVRSLAALQQSVEESLSPLGFPTEERGFHPHLTLARTSRNAHREELAAIGRAAERGVGELGSWMVESISLMRSQLRPAGAVYTREALIPL